MVQVAVSDNTGRHEKAVVLELPWPPMDLSPNARVHWAKLARAKKQYRQTCAWIALARGMHRMNAEKVEAAFCFYPASKRRIDLDNCIARMKAGIDGLVDVIGIDDSKWCMTFTLSDKTRKHGAVSVVMRFV